MHQRCGLKSTPVDHQPARFLLKLFLPDQRGCNLKQRCSAPWILRRDFEHILPGSPRKDKKMDRVNRFRVPVSQPIFISSAFFGRHPEIRMGKDQSQD